MRNFKEAVLASLTTGFLLVSSQSYSTVAQVTPGITWAGCGVTKKAFMTELARAYETKTGIKISLQGGGATRGIRDAAQRKVDIGGSCRMNLPEEERTELYAEMHPVAWDALAIIVNKNNPVQDLSTDQIKAMYMGQITNWNQVGGPDAPVRMYTRRGKISGVGYAIRQYIFKDSNIEFKTEYQVNSSGPLEKAVETDVNAIGITGISSARKRDVKILSFDGKIPSYENVRDGHYGLYRPLYIVTGPSSSKQVKEFISYIRSEEGRKILRVNQTVPYQDAPRLMAKMLIYGFDVK